MILCVLTASDIIFSAVPEEKAYKCSHRVV